MLCRCKPVICAYDRWRGGFSKTRIMHTLICISNTIRHKADNGPVACIGIVCRYVGYSLPFPRAPKICSLVDANSLSAAGGTRDDVSYWLAFHIRIKVIGPVCGLQINNKTVGFDGAHAQAG